MAEKTNILNVPPPGPDTPEKSLLKQRMWWLLMQITDGNYIVDEHNREQLSRICAVFSNQGDDLRGFGMVGSPGSGKSILMRVMQQVVDRPRGNRRPVIYTALSLADMYSKDGPDVMKRALSKDMIIDDIGAEYVAAHYGSKVEVIENIIQLRYDQFQMYGTRTHFTSNLSMEDIGERYGERVYGRLMQMCEIVVLAGQDRRLSGVPFRWMEYPWPPDESFIEYMKKIQEYNPETEPVKPLSDQVKKRFHFSSSGKFDENAYAEYKSEMLKKMSGKNKSE